MLENNHPSGFERPTIERFCNQFELHFEFYFELLAVMARFGYSAF